ncbi:MAG: hypothetical protein CMB47_07055 [Euryarchaeota archaeon]|nr:hypothetical protein [Euryarchaeota archaeon]
MGYLIRDSNTKASFSFSPLKLKVYRAEEEVDEPVETVVEQEEEVIPEEAQGQSTEQAPTGDSEVEELDPVEQEEVTNQEEQEEEVIPEETEEESPTEESPTEESPTEESPTEETPAEEAPANTNKSSKATTASRGGGGGGGGRGPYMSKNDKLWNKKLKSKSKKPSVKVEETKSNVGIRIVGVLASLGVAYGAYRTINKSL